ncbi:ANTAR domain-containing protein [Amycolatopsis sp. NPDC051371]|uniref:ANTAR domain-containing protein n=1 Tax=Amycolatopsis sp. NPDC051371 TaxID=3155800 RepID=UPI0034199382
MDECRMPVRHPLWSAEVVRTGSRPVVVVTGELDMEAHPGFAERLRQLTSEAREPVVDLSRVRVLTEAGVRQLHAVADAFAGTGRRLRVVTGTGAVLRVLRAAQATDVIETFVTLAAVDGARRPSRSVPAAPDASGADEVGQLRLEVAALRSKLASRPVIARALGVLEERYRLADMDEAYRLLRYASQTHHVKLLGLAKALLELPRPHNRSWLTGALHLPPPPLSFATGRAATTPASVLDQVLRVAVESTGAAAGYTQLPEETGLRLAAHRGLGAEFTTAFAHLEDEQSTCTAAFLGDVAVMSTDIARDPRFCRPGTHRVLLDAGFRAAWSIPLRTPTADCAGVLTTLFDHVQYTFIAQSGGRLDTLCREAGRWLHWHRRHQVLTACPGGRMTSLLRTTAWREAPTSEGLTAVTTHDGLSTSGELKTNRRSCSRRHGCPNRKFGMRLRRLPAIVWTAIPALGRSGGMSARGRVAGSVG